jgi:hypothetical protein
LNTEVEIHAMTGMLGIICVVLGHGDGNERKVRADTIHENQLTGWKVNVETLLRQQPDLISLCFIFVSSRSSG